MNVGPEARRARGSWRPLVLGGAAVHVAVIAIVLAMPGPAQQAAYGAAEAVRLWCGVR